MRTEEEILERLNNMEKGSDFFGVISNDLLEFLSFGKARSFLKKDATQEQWEKVAQPREDRAVEAVMLSYMKFAWSKANGCRGLSAWRSLDHMRAWLWLLGDSDEQLEFLVGHKYYGKPHLVTICERFDFNWRSLDDDVWVDSETDSGVSADEVLRRLSG